MTQEIGKVRKFVKLSVVIIFEGENTKSTAFSPFLGNAKMASSNNFINRATGGTLRG